MSPLQVLEDPLLLLEIGSYLESTVVMAAVCKGILATSSQFHVHRVNFRQKDFGWLSRRFKDVSQRVIGVCSKGTRYSGKLIDMLGRMRAVELRHPPCDMTLLNLKNICKLQLSARVFLKVDTLDLPMVTHLTIEGFENRNVRNPKDFSFIKKMTCLQKLVINYPTFNDASLVSGLKNLVHLDLLCTQVSDVQPLVGLEKLETLNIAFTNVSDVSVLSQCKRLRTLLVEHCPRLHLPSLRTLKQITSLDAAQEVWDRPPSEGFECLQVLANLTYLRLYNPLHPDISWLSSLRRLQSLSLGCVNVRDISPLGSLHLLTRMKLFHALTVDDWSPIGTLINLKHLSLVLANMDSFRHLQSLSALLTLHYVAKTTGDPDPTFVSVDGIQNLVSLQEFYIDGIVHTDIDKVDAFRNAGTHEVDVMSGWSISILGCRSQSH